MAERRIVLGAALLLTAVAGLGGMVAYLSESSAPPPVEAPVASPAPAGPPAASVKQEIMAAVELGKAGNIKGAAQKLEAILEKHPEDSDALFNYGVALAALGRTEEADAVFVQLLALSPEDHEAVAERATLKLMAGDTEGAIDMIAEIPVGRSKLRERLSGDPRWIDVGSNPRLQQIRAKHELRDLSYAK